MSYLGLPSNRIARKYPRISSRPRLGEQPTSLRGQITDAALIRQFITAGRATFTVEALKTGTRFTYKVDKAKTGSMLFVKVLTGPENSTDYTYIGFIRNGVFSHGVKSSPIAADAPSVRAFDWFHRAAHQDQFPSSIRFFHEGKCANCRKKLTVPASIATGFGPDCAEALGIEWSAPVCEAA